jgi:hypothetical protein
VAKQPPEVTAVMGSHEPILIVSLFYNKAEKVGNNRTLTTQLLSRGMIVDVK